MSHKNTATIPVEIEVDAIDLAGLALALRIVVNDCLAHPAPAKMNALDALTSALLSRAQDNVQAITGGADHA